MSECQLGQLASQMDWRSLKKDMQPRLGKQWRLISGLILIKLMHDVSSAKAISMLSKCESCRLLCNSATFPYSPGVLDVHCRTLGEEGVAAIIRALPPVFGAYEHLDSPTVH